MEDTTANGSCGSRVSSATGTRVARGANGTGGWSNTGRSLGARAAIWWTGGATDRGPTAAGVKSAGRSSGAYSGPSSQVAMQVMVDGGPASAAASASARNVVGRPRGTGYA